MEKFERAMGMKPSEWNDRMAELLSQCRCHECATFLRAAEASQKHFDSLGWGVSQETSESGLGRQFCHVGQSPRISEKWACLCRNCPVARELFITHTHYCIHGDAPHRLGALE